MTTKGNMEKIGVWGVFYDWRNKRLADGRNVATDRLMFHGETWEEVLKWITGHNKLNNCLDPTFENPGENCEGWRRGEGFIKAPPPSKKEEWEAWIGVMESLSSSRWYYAPVRRAETTDYWMDKLPSDLSSSQRKRFKTLLDNLDDGAKEGAAEDTSKAARKPAALKDEEDSDQ